MYADRGSESDLSGWSVHHLGKYSDFLEKREDYLASQAKEREALANLVRREIEWLRRGPKREPRKSKARIANAGGVARSNWRSRRIVRDGTADIDFTGTGRRTQATGQSPSDRTRLRRPEVFRSVIRTGAGHALGLLGANGSGKTSLLQDMAGEAKPDSGSIQFADGLR